MLEEISKLISPEKLTLENKKVFETKLIKWIMITDFIRGIIWPTYTIDPISHIRDMGLTSEIWRKFELLYQDSRFNERDSIFIQLFI